MQSTAMHPGLSLGAVIAMATAAAAQPTISATTDVVTPGQAVNVTVTGAPGQTFALVGSSVGAGQTFGGTPFKVGTDFTILVIGTLSGAGSAVVPVVPPFLGATLDRYYVQGATSASAAFATFQLTPGLTLRNSDLISNTGRIRICNNTGALADPPNLIFSFMVVAP